jgi:uncharacterized membrane protein YkgB
MLPKPLPADAVLDPALPSLSTIGRLGRFFSVHPMEAFYHVEQWVVRRLALYGLVFTRVALGVIFLWFGVLKFFPIVLPIDVLAEKILVVISFHLFRPETCLHVLAFFECVIGVGMLTKRFMRLTVALLFLQMPGTFLPLILLRQETWIHFPYLPTLVGQYIIKNIALIAAGLVVGATVRGGKIIAHPEVAEKAQRVELAVEAKALQARESGRAAT